MSSTPSECNDTNGDGINDPSIYATVTGSIERDVHFCEEIWHLPEDSGVTKEICPTEYIFWSPTTTSTALGEYWKAPSSGSGYNVVLNRKYQHESTKCFSVAITRTEGLDSQYWAWTGSSWETQAKICNIGICCGSQGTSISNYRILDNQFGSWVGPQNITYKWERGRGW